MLTFSFVYVIESEKIRLQNRNTLRFNTLRRLNLDEICAGFLLAEIIFKDIATCGAFKDFCSKHIENADVLDVFSLNFSDSLGRIGINRKNIVFDFRNSSGFSFNKLIETIQPYWVIPIGALISCRAFVRNSKYLSAKLFKHNTIPSRLIAKFRRRGGQRNSSSKP